MTESVSPTPPSSGPIRTIEELLTGPDEIPNVRVVGDFSDQVRFVTSTGISIILNFAKVEDTDATVLLPFADVKIKGGRSDESDELVEEALFSHVLPLENAAFLVVNLVSDLRSACEDLASLAGSGTPIERMRLEQTRFYLGHTVREAVAATGQLTALLESTPHEPKAASANPTQAETRSDLT